MSGEVRAEGGEVSGEVREQRTEQVPGQPVEQVERSVGLMVRLTPAERAGWHAAARAAGWGKTAGWVRQVVADRLSAPSSSAGSASGSSSGSGVGSGQVVADELARVRRELVRIGSNVNQVAFQVNAGAVAGHRVEAEVLRRELAAVRGELGALRAAVQARTDAATTRPTPVPVSAPAPARTPAPSPGPASARASAPAPGSAREPGRRPMTDQEVWAWDEARVQDAEQRLKAAREKLAALKAQQTKRQEGRR